MEPVTVTAFLYLWLALSLVACWYMIHQPR